MKFGELYSIGKRLYQNYINKFILRILIALFLSVLVAGSTSAIAWLLDPAIKKIFIEQDKTYALIIPFAIILAFSTKGISLYFARTNIIKIGYWICGKLQKQMSNTILFSDTETIDKKHSGNSFQIFLYDATHLNELLAQLLNIMKDSLINNFVNRYVLSKLKLALFAIINASGCVRSKISWKKNKASTESTDLSGKLSLSLRDIERFKNNKNLSK